MINNENSKPILNFFNGLVPGIGMVTIRYGDDLRVCMNSDKASISKEELNYIIAQISEEVNKLAEEVDAAHKAISSGDEEAISKLPLSRKRSSTHKNYEDSFQHSFEQNSLRFRLHHSISTIKDSLSKFREP